MTAFDPFNLRTCESLAGSRARVPGFAPRPGLPFAPFEIHDPFGLRTGIVPVFCQHVDGRMYGVGTAFHVDGFGTFVTAHHVVDYVSRSPAARPVLFLGMQAVVFGTVAIPSDCFVPAREVVVPMMGPDDPMAALRGRVEACPAVDLAVLTPEEIGPQAHAPQTVPVRARGWTPKLGEIVLAVGFPQLDLSEVDPAAQSALLEEGMQGAYGRIVAVHTDGVSRSNPSPVIEVESDWPGGMSGGPVFNAAGEVVGVVSRSLRADAGHGGTGFAVYLGLLPQLQGLLHGVDLENPGWRRGWGVFLESGCSPVCVHPTEQLAKDAASQLAEATATRRIVHRIGTLDFVDCSDPEPVPGAW